MNFMKKNRLCIAAALFGLAHASVVVAGGTQQLAAEQSARPLSAFFGLDNNLPFGANVLCLGVWGEDVKPALFYNLFWFGVIVKNVLNHRVSGALSRIRTCDPPLRRRMLYPAELPGRAPIISKP